MIGIDNPHHPTNLVLIAVILVYGCYMIGHSHLSQLSPQSSTARAKVHGHICTCCVTGALYQKPLPLQRANLGFSDSQHAKDEVRGRADTLECC